MQAATEAIARRVETEYVLETERTRDLLRQCGVAEEELSKNGQMHLHVLAEMAALLQIKDTKLSSYLMAVSDLIEQVDDAEKRETELQRETADRQKQSHDLQAEWQDLQHVKQQLEDAVDEREKHENSVTIQQQTAEYESRRQAYEEELNTLDATLQDSGFSALQDSIEHHRLAAFERECQELEAGNEALRKQLRSFHDLPLNSELAAAELKRAQNELIQLEDVFNRHIRDMV